MLEKISDQEFQEKVIKDPSVKLVLFHATWCGFCSRFCPTFDAKGGENSAHFVKVDISNEDSFLWDTESVEVVPTLAIYKDGQQVYKNGGMLHDGHLAHALTALKKVS